MNITTFQLPGIFMSLIVVATCAWASLLAHLCISNFNDGARPIFPEFMEGRMSRIEFATVVTGMGVGWVLVGFSQWLGTGLIAVHLTLIASDCIGVWSPNKWVALALGAAYGLVCALGTNLINAGFSALPYNFLEDMTAITTPVLPIFSMYPAIAIAGQFGAKKGIIASVIEAAVYLLCFFVDHIQLGQFTFYVYPYTIAMLVGMICLIYFAAQATRENKEETVADENEENLFAKNAARIRSNWVYLCIQGAINAIGVKTLSMVYMPETLAPAAAAGNLGPYVIALCSDIISFIPLVVSTSLATGVYGAQGLASCVLGGIIAPTWWLAPFFGFAFEFVEIQLLGLLGKGLGKFPELIKCGDHVKDAMISCTSIALTLGSFLAAHSIWGSDDGGYEIGIMLIGLIYLINEITGQRIPKAAVGPIGAVIVGILYNVMVVLGLVVL